MPCLFIPYTGSRFLRTMLSQSLLALRLDTGTVIVQLLKTGITLQLATADHWKAAERGRLHHVERLHAQP